MALRFRRNTAAGAVAGNRTLESGEPGFEVDTGRFKIGDGVTPWNTLTYAGELSQAAYRASTVELRFRGLPKLMASPPTVTVTNDTVPATTMSGVGTLPGTSYTSILCDDLTKYTPLGVGSALPVRGSGGAYAFVCGWASSPNIPEVVTFEFLFDGPTFEICLRQFTGAQYRIMVNGEYVARYPVSLGGTANSAGNVKVAFGSSDVRHIAFEYTGTGTTTWGVWFGATNTMRAVEQPKRRLLIAGDSYAGGSTSSPLGSYGTYLARALGFRDYVNSGAGGSGWLAPGASQNVADRLTTDVINQAPTDLIFALGHNDTSFSNSAITTQVAAVLAATRTALPNLKSLVVVGPLFAGGTPGVYTAMSAAIRAGATVADAYIDTTTSPIFTGSGKVGSTTGVGNSDLDIASDGTHPTDAGSLWLGVSLAYAIEQAIAGV